MLKILIIHIFSIIRLLAEDAWVEQARSHSGIIMGGGSTVSLHEYFTEDRLPKLLQMTEMSPENAHLALQILNDAVKMEVVEKEKMRKYLGKMTKAKKSPDRITRLGFINLAGESGDAQELKNFVNNSDITLLEKLLAANFLTINFDEEMDEKELKNIIGILETAYSVAQNAKTRAEFLTTQELFLFYKQCFAIKNWSLLNQMLTCVFNIEDKDILKRYANLSIKFIFDENRKVVNVITIDPKTKMLVDDKITILHETSILKWNQITNNG